MKFFAIHLPDLEGEAFTMASDEQVVTWIYLHAYCCKQLNGGEIEAADAIPAKHWHRHGLEHHEILSEPSPLWEWEGGTLRVKPYDLDGQELFEKKSKAGRETAAKRWGKNRSATSAAPSSASRSPDSSPDSCPDAPNSTRDYPNRTEQGEFRVSPSRSAEISRSKPDPRSMRAAHGSAEEFEAYALALGLPAIDGAWLHSHFEANGWKRGKGGKEPVRDWKASMRTWQGRGWLPSQKAGNPNAVGSCL